MHFRSFLPTLLTLSLTALATNAYAAPFTVTRNADDGRAGTLRAAIESANTTMGADTIEFNITGPPRIVLDAARGTLNITDSVFINGYSQTGSDENTLVTGATNAVPGIEINGAAIAGSANGFRITNTTDVEIRGLSITGFDGNAIAISDSSDITVAGCFLGLTSAGAVDGNGNGISTNNVDSSLFGGSAIEDKNVISGNTLDGIHLSFGSNANRVRGNLIGTDKAGTTKIPNGRTGVSLDNSDNTLLGGTGTFEGNLLSGNQRGISSLSSDGTQIKRNRIGTDVSGQFDLGNGADGLFFEGGTGILIGDTSSLAGNTIAFNGGDGIELRFANGNQILSNRIGARASGTAVTGAAGSGNADNGVLITFGENNIIGAAGDGNIICANGSDGISVAGNQGTAPSGTQIIGNFIGLDGASNARGNEGNGIRTSGFVDTTTIGSTATNGRNYLSGNGAAGILLSGDPELATSATLINNYIGTNSGGTAAVPNGTDGVRITAANNTLGNNTTAGRNLISGNPGTGVAISSRNNRLLGNLIGTNFDGTTAVPNGDGVSVSGAGATGNLIGNGGATRNIISGNNAPFTGYGIHITGGASGNRVRGCFIGTDVTGTVEIGNKRGIVIEDAAGNAVGAGSGATRNVIAGGEFGILISGTNAKTNTVTGNYVGTDTTGNAALPNEYGIAISDGASGNTIGGDITASPLAGNLVSGNDNYNILISAANGNFVHGNRVGTRADGLAALGTFTTSAGVGVATVSSGNRVGGTVGTRNVIAGNANYGVLVQNLNTRDNRVLSNYIGVGSDGTTAVPNGRSGVAISDGASQNIIGTTAAGEGNRIANNRADGVTVFGVPAGAESFGNSIRGNSIFKNTELGINLHPMGEAANIATPNDETNRDADTGPNSLQNAPVVSVVRNGANVDVTVRLTASPNQSYILDLYRSATADAVAGEGETFVASSAATPANTNGALSVRFSVPAAGGEFFSATATATANSANTKIGDTSEFSRSVRVPALVTLRADYRFVDNLKSSVGAPPDLTQLGTGAFASEAVGTAAPTRVYRFDDNSGLQLAPARPTLGNGTYTLAIIARLDDVTGYNRLVDFTNGKGDSGFYVLNQKLNLFPDGSGSAGSPTVDRNVFYQWVFTREVSGTTRAYVNGVPSFVFSDTNGDAALSADNIMRLFRDDDTIADEASAGAISRLRIWDGALTPAQVGALDGNPRYGAGIVVVAANPLATTEGRTSASFTVRLATQPTTDVSVPIKSSDITEGTVDKATLLFTDANWNIAQTVTVRGVDDTLVDGDVNYQIQLLPANSADPQYANLDKADLAAINRDNDVAPVATGILAWGYNTYGQIGDGTRDHRSRPVRVTAYGTVDTLAAGGGHSLVAQTSTATGARAAGYNAAGQLGDSTQIDRPAPVAVSNVRNIKVLAAGWYHSLALLNDGTVWAWGYNASGELGDGTTQNRAVPVRVQGLTDVVAVAAGTYHSAALKLDGSVWTWGNNFYGQIGDGTNDDRLIPVRVATLSNASAIACGGAHTLAIAGGSVYAWGWNSDGQLGDGTRTDRFKPIVVEGITGASRVAAGYLHSLALVGTGVRAWGDNDLGQLGRATTDDALRPLVSQVSAVSEIAAGGAHSLALRQDKTLWAWGNNAYGGLGDGATANRVTPAPVPGLSNVLKFAGGYAHTLAVGTYAAPAGSLARTSPLSSASASATTERVSLAWITPLSSSAGNAANFIVSINGRAATFSAAYSATSNATTLSIDGGLVAGDTVAVSWRDLKTTGGESVADGSVQTVAR
ncbi:MAG TPA: NosD domain-containing protein [Abditibacteriaceae bacterium]|jgi:alpha-tubulin suppressor-like RCC1 family protein